MPKNKTIQRVVPTVRLKMVNKYNPDIRHRRSIRLKGYDYSEAGAYFVTICTKDRECLFGDVVNGEMRLNEAGKMVQKWWYEIATKFRNIELDGSVIMPNHLHGIIVISVDNCRGEVSSPVLKTDETKTRKEGGVPPPLRKRTLGQIVAYFKYQTTKQINQNRNTPRVPVWQRNYYDRIIRNETELNKMREYILNNPLNWETDENYRKD
ncbi:MAG: transposase [Nitrospirota bacterium]